MRRGCNQSRRARLLRRQIHFPIVHGGPLPRTLSLLDIEIRLRMKTKVREDTNAAET